MKVKRRKGLGLFLALSMVLSMIAGDLNLVNAKTEEVNVAPDAEVFVADEDTSWGGVKTNINDENVNSYWSYPGNEWPQSVCFKLAQITTVKKVVVRLGASDWSTKASVDVELKYARNGITTDLQTFGEKQTNVPLGTDLTVTATVPVDVSHIYVEISNPQAINGYDGDMTLWPSIREVEIYEEREEKLSDYNNIAAQATISTDGKNPQNAEYLTDNNAETLYKFHNGQQNEEKYVLLTFDKPRLMDAFEIAFEQVDNEPYNYQFVYSLYGIKENQEAVLLVDHQTANRTDAYYQSYKIDETEYQAVKIVIHETTNEVEGVAGNGWPAIAEFGIYGSEDVNEDSESIAYKKPVHANSNRTIASNINDGSTNTDWKGTMYPGYVDIDLEANYNLSEIQVFTPENGYSQYSLYTSLDGRDFSKLAEKTSKDTCPSTGEKYSANNVEARYVRVYVEYNSASSQSIINEVRVLGSASGSTIQQTPAIEIPTYDESSYGSATTSLQDAYNEVYGIIERRLGSAYKDWFTLKIADNPKNHDYDYFNLSMSGDKVLIEGNNGVSLAMGLNHYLKYSCNVNISQVGDQVSMPATIVTLSDNVFKETKAKVRYAYNYCTLSYSMPFYGQEEWRNELDWLALNGVNVVLDATAQEEVWRRFLGKIGYDHSDIKDFIAGPAYYAWAYMANLSGFGGPVHDSWFEQRTELARQNQLAMRRLGMQPVLQGYSGMVPNDLSEHDASVSGDIIKQGTWCSFQRPDMLKTDSATYQEYASLFYESQEEVYGNTSNYYATDPFHEGGNTGGMSGTTVASKVLDSLLDYDQDGIWIIQSWQGNPTNALLNGLDGREDHALVLDLYAEKTPNNQSYGDTPEFDETPWVFCMLNNFGGRLGLHGHLDNLANNIPEVFNRADYVQGIGITPEASVNNPLLYDFLFETVWCDDATKDLAAIDLDSWLEDYQVRRYGAKSEAAYEALEILKETVYKASNNMKGQGAPESVVNARPAFSINAASSWGNAVIDYDKNELERAAKLMLQDYELLKDSEGYRYDLATVLEQVLSNSAQEYLKVLKKAYNSGSVDKFSTAADEFIEIINKMDEVTSTSKYYLLGTWVNQAKDLASNADDFTKELYEMNAKSLITTWGSINQAESGGLHDYSNRQWSGLINDFYKARWEIWLNNRLNELKGETVEDSDWFEWEWTWARSDKEFTSTPSDVNLATVGGEILEKFSVGNINNNPASKADNDIDVSTISVTTGSYQPDNNKEGDPKYVLDNNTGTIWHTAWGGSPRADHYLEFTLEEEQEITGLRYLPRVDGGINGIVTKYEIWIKNSDSDQWQKIVTDGSLDSSNLDWEILGLGELSSIKAKQVRFVVDDALSSETGNLYASLAEMRILKPKTIVDTSKLEAYLDELEKQGIAQDDYTTDSYNIFARALTNANEIKDNSGSAQEQVDEALVILQNAFSNLVKRGDSQLLKDKLAALKTLNANDYTEETWQALQKVISKVNQMLENEGNITELDVQTSSESLDKAQANLVTRVAVSKEILANYIENNQLNELNVDLYMSKEAKKFSVLLKEANRLIVEGNNVSQIEQAYTDLQAARNALVLKATAEQIRELNNLVEVKNEEDYTTVSWQKYAKTLEIVQTALKDEISLEDAQKYLSSLKEKQELLVSKKDFADLKSLLAKAKDMNAKDYTEASYNDLKVVIKEVETALDNQDITQKEVSMLLGKLQKSIADLKTVNQISDNVSVNEPDKIIGNKTGDEQTFVGAIVMLLISANVIGLLLYRKRRD